MGYFAGRIETNMADAVDRLRPIASHPATDELEIPDNEAILFATNPVTHNKSRLRDLQIHVPEDGLYSIYAVYFIERVLEIRINGVVTADAAQIFGREMFEKCHEPINVNRAHVYNPVTRRTRGKNTR